MCGIFRTSPDHKRHRTMQDFAPFRWVELVEQKPPLRHSHSAEFHKTFNGNANITHLNLGLNMTFHVSIFTMAAILLLITLSWRCPLSKRRGSTSGLGRRMLASGGGQQDEEDGRKRSQACENLGQFLAAQEGGDSVSNPPPYQPTGASVEAAADEERPRKTKRKSKHDAEDTEETSEQPTKMTRMDEEEIDSDLEMDPDVLMKLLFPSIEEPTSSFSLAPPFRPDSEERTDSDTLEQRIIKGKSTLMEWILDPKDNVPLTIEEQRMPQGSGDLSPLEGTSSHFVYDLSSYAVESQGLREPSGNTEMTLPSGAVSGVQPVSSQHPLPHVSQPSQMPQSDSRPEGSAAVQRNIILRSFSPLRSSPSPRMGGLVAVLKPLELLLRNEHRSAEALQAIIEASENLYLYANRYLVAHPMSNEAHKLIDVAIRRLLAADALWRACNVVGPAMDGDKWWPGFMRNLYGDAMQWRPHSEGTERAGFLQRIVAMLESFNRGVPPEPKEFAEIMQTVFHRKTGLAFLRGSEWELWREGDEDS